MLEELRVRDVVLLKEGDLEFGPGLTVLTGETGAGKTALVSALKLLMGARGDSTMVREGAEQAVVEGRFFRDGEETLVRRSLSSEGRSRCYLDDAMVGVSTLAESIGVRVDLSGQHDHQSLLRPGSHVEHLDRFIGDEARDAREAYRSALRAMTEAQQAYDEVVDRVAQAGRDADAHRHALEQIEAVDIRSGEYEELVARLPSLQHADALSTLIAESIDALRGERAAGDLVGSAVQSLAKAAELDPSLGDLHAHLHALSVGIDEAAMDLRGYRDGLDHDGTGLERVLERLAAYDRLIRQWGPDVDDVLERAQRARVSLELADDGGLALSEAQRALEAASKSLAEAGGLLSDVRRRGAAGFTDALTDAIADLGMAGGSITVGFEATGTFGPEGPERVEFRYAPSPTSTPRPLSRIASGGELSRVMLALKGVLLDGGDSVETLVFDEVDAGIGGATARAVARRIKALASAYQVIVVTHLPQVAAVADGHLLVQRSSGSDATTTVRAVTGEDRVAEIARMLAGSTDAAALAHARELLDRSG